jgi:hypothetical protein
MRTDARTASRLRDDFDLDSHALALALKFMSRIDELGGGVARTAGSVSRVVYSADASLYARTSVIVVLPPFHFGGIDLFCRARGSGEKRYA